MESKTPMIFVKHITAAQRGNENSIRYLCDHTSEQFIKICRSYNLTDSEIEAVLDKAYGQIFSDLRSVRDPLNFMNWANGLVRGCCEETVRTKKASVSKESEVPAPVEVVKAPVPDKETPVMAQAKDPEVSTLVKEPVSPKEPSAFYDENAYLEPEDTFRAELNYADEELNIQTPLYRNESPSDSTAEVSSASGLVSEKSVEQILKEVAAAASSSEEEAIFEDYRPIRKADPEVLQMTPAKQTIVPASEPPVSKEEEEDPKEEQETPKEQEETVTEEDVNIDVNETDSGTEYDDDFDNLDDEDEEDDNEGILGLLKEYRARVLFVIFGIFIFGACVGIGYAISRGLTSGSNASYDPASVTQVPSVESDIQSSGLTQPDSVLDSSVESTVSAPTPTAEENRQKSTDSPNANSNADNQQASNPASSTESADPTTREVTARTNIQEYLGETFASVFRDYPNMSRSVYHGELSYANEFIGFIGSYDATKPVSSTIVESVSLLTAADDYNIDGFYIGMSSSDAAALASAGGYVEQDIPNEYVDEQGNILTLTIDGGTIRNVTLRLDLADQVSMEMADEVPEEITNEGVG